MYCDVYAWQSNLSVWWVTSHTRRKRKYILGRPVFRDKYQGLFLLELIPREGDQCVDDTIVI